MSTFRERRMRRETVKSSPTLQRMQKHSIIVFVSLLGLGALVGGILWGVFHHWILLVISLGVSLGIFGFCMIIFVFRFLFSFSAGSLEMKEPKEDEIVLAETRVNLDMITEANKQAKAEKAKGKNIKLFSLLIYGWLFITIIVTIAGGAIDQIFRPGKVPLYMFIGMGCFVFTILGLIIFGSVIPNRKIKTGSRHAAKNYFSKTISAIVKDTSFRTSTTRSVGRVTETFLLTFETPYGDSKCLYTIRNLTYGDIKSDSKRFEIGDVVSIIIDPNNPKYCAIKSKKA